MANNWYKGADRKEQKQELRPGHGELGGSEQDIRKLQQSNSRQGREHQRGAQDQGQSSPRSDRNPGKKRRDD